ncbi:GLPGLI family protein [Chryseobacterium camelliae]|uniref:GLPGLI family protein n=1 Tax=Chryseobacterium camelliae TaxID=1265445 RepID=A0ABY7QM63_9FLAO|nr:GLPGLI family protein [Chryseobacterium camelliae]WBV60754.1 GLPGLI family protein [Chryseobacterium camelliae]
MYFNRLILIIIVFLSFYASAQNKVFLYEMKYKPNRSKDSIITDKTVLDITTEGLSVFRTLHDKVSDSLKAKTGLGLGRKNRFENQFYIVKKLNVNEIQKIVQNIYSDVYFIKNDEKLIWKIYSEKSKLEKFDIQKAEVNYGGRKWIAWFAPDIPINDGPYVFYGLPGLIVKIEDEERNFSFNLIEVQNSSGTVNYRNKGIMISWTDFQKIALDYYADPFAPAKSLGIPIRVDDGQGNAIKPNMRNLIMKVQKDIRENNNPIELDKIILYK